MLQAAQRPNLFQRLMQSVASSRPGAWLFARTMHYFDSPFLRWSGNRCPTMLLGGVPTVGLVTTIGARSGQKREVPLIVVPGDDGALALIASNWGQARHPAWYHNLRANPEVEVTLKGETRSYRARVAEEHERKHYLSEGAKLYVGYPRYQQYAGDRTIPVMILTPELDGEMQTAG